MCARLSVGLALLWVLMAAGCQPVPLQTAPAVTPQVLTVDLTPALRDLIPDLSGCAREQGTLGLVVNEMPASILDKDPGQMSLRWGAPAGLPGYAAELGSEPLAVIIHPANPLSALTRAQLRAVFGGSARNWNDLPDCQACAGSELDGKEIHAWAYSPGEDIQQIFESAIGLHVPAAAAGLAPHPQAARQAVAEDVQAVGFIPARLVDGSVRVLTLADIPSEALTRPILALSPVEPQGLAREWLGCVQEKLKP